MKTTTLALPEPSRTRELENYCRVREAHLASPLLHASNYTGPRITSATQEEIIMEEIRVWKAKDMKARHLRELRQKGPSWTLELHDAPPGSAVWIVGTVWHLGGANIRQSLGMCIAKTPAKAKRMHHELTRQGPQWPLHAAPITTTAWKAGTEIFKTF